MEVVCGSHAPVLGELSNLTRHTQPLWILCAIGANRVAVVVYCTTDSDYCASILVYLRVNALEYISLFDSHTYV